MITETSADRVKGSTQFEGRGCNGEAGSKVFLQFDIPIIDVTSLPSGECCLP